MGNNNNMNSNHGGLFGNNNNMNSNHGGLFGNMNNNMSNNMMLTNMNTNMNNNMMITHMNNNSDSLSAQIFQIAHSSENQNNMNFTRNQNNFS